ncbi:MAG: ethanolamine ammonia-lyase subunit EutB, partial [Deltaproteobacteria bacterium]|nr:ethanolamine ammonia-lyase subunit EutB [Deltaproteobacteria bacterium]
MILKTKLAGQVYAFKSLTDVLAKANDEKSGDVLLDRAARTVTERTAAKIVLANVTLEDIYENPVLPPEKDEVSQVLKDDLSLGIYRKIKTWTVGELRNWLLAHETSGEDIIRMSRGIEAEAAAAVAKLMTAMDLVAAAAKIVVPTTCATTIGLPGTLSYRNQPNHPADDLEGIKASLCEGLSYGSGDAIFGVNPVEDTVDNTLAILNLLYDFMEKWQVPTQNCVLAHVTTQMKAVEKGA